MLTEEIGGVEFVMHEIVVGDTGSQALGFVQAAAAHALEMVRDQATQLLKFRCFIPDFFHTVQAEVAENQFRNGYSHAADGHVSVGENPQDVVYMTAAL